MLLKSASGVEDKPETEWTSRSCEPEALNIEVEVLAIAKISAECASLAENVDRYCLDCQVFEHECRKRIFDEHFEYIPF